MNAAFSPAVSSKLSKLFNEDDTGVVGGGKGSIEQDLDTAATRRRLWTLLSKVSKAKTQTIADTAVKEYSKHPVPGMGVGTVSSLLWALKPKWYPIVNGGSKPGMKELFIDFKSPGSLEEYLDLAKRLRVFLKDTKIRTFSKLDRFCRGIKAQEWAFPDRERLVLKQCSNEVEASANEGAKKLTQILTSKRNRGLRRAVLEKHGYRCQICEFDFLDTYGVEYAHVHHKKELAGLTKNSIITKKDLEVLCANCHMMIHHPAFAGDMGKLERRVKRAKRRQSRTD